MTEKDQIDYMIKSLYLAKSEIEYAEAYRLRKSTDKSFGHDFYFGYGDTHRVPNRTVIRESLRMISRLAGILANEVVADPNSEEIFKNEKW